MYILINLDTLVVSYKSQSLEVLCNLAWVEFSNMSYIVGQAEPTILRGLPPSQLSAIYKNTTGEELPTENRNAILQIFCDLFENMVEVEVNAEELEIQAATITTEERGYYKYQFGSRKPKLLTEFSNPALKAQVDQIKLQSALAGNYPALKESNVAVIRRITTDPEKPNKGADSVSKVKAPKAGTTCAQIWDLADKLWESMGKPCEKPSIDNLKKNVLSVLLPEGINRSTITTQLSHWSRNRLS